MQGCACTVLTSRGRRMVSPGPITEEGGCGHAVRVSAGGGEVRVEIDMRVDPEQSRGVPMSSPPGGAGARHRTGCDRVVAAEDQGHRAPFHEVVGGGSQGAYPARDHLVPAGVPGRLEVAEVMDRRDLRELFVQPGGTRGIGPVGGALVPSAQAAVRAQNGDLVGLSSGGTCCHRYRITESE